ncbi:MAG TPA: hypothetical protein VF618_19200, partial [Thermoanaerobaculia bacterium]
MRHVIRGVLVCWLVVAGWTGIALAQEQVGGSPATEATPATEASPHPTYIVVLKESWQMPPRTDSTEGHQPVDEPDFAGHGGQLKAKWRTRRVVTLPPPAVEALPRHPSVLYLQRVNTGAPDDRPEIHVS